MKVTFVGSGVYGQALGDLASSNGHTVRYYDPYKFPEVKLDDAVNDADLVVYAAPAEARDEIIPSLLVDTPLLCVSKGVVTPQPFRFIRQTYALAGAAFAEDINTDTPRLGDKILLTASTPLAEELFTAPKIQIQYHEDTRGIMLMGALKVAFSLYAGYQHPDGLDDPQKFLSEVHPEYENWLSTNHCSQDLIRLSCGLPDLLISITPNSRNFTMGQTLRQTGKMPKSHGTVEGITVLTTLGDYDDLILPEHSVLLDFARTVTSIVTLDKASTDYPVASPNQPGEES